MHGVPVGREGSGLFLPGDPGLWPHCLRTVDLSLPASFLGATLPTPSSWATSGWNGEASRPGGSELKGASQGSSLLATEQGQPGDHSQHSGLRVSEAGWPGGHRPKEAGSDAGSVAAS